MIAGSDQMVHLRPAEYQQLHCSLGPFTVPWRLLQFIGKLERVKIG